MGHNIALTQVIIFFLSLDEVWIEMLRKEISPIYFPLSQYAHN